MDTQADDAVQDSLELDKKQAETLRDKLQLNCDIISNKKCDKVGAEVAVGDKD